MPLKLNAPTFPNDVSTVPLVVVDFDLVEKGCPDEIQRLWYACTSIGFFYLKNHRIDGDTIFSIGEDIMELPTQVKMRFEQGDSGRSFGYKPAGANTADAKGSPDTVEWINIAKDDILSFPSVTHRTYPNVVNNHMPDLSDFVNSSDAIARVLLGALSERLGLPAGLLMAQHDFSKQSQCETTIIKKPGVRDLAADTRTAIAAHTDFGSLSLLHNRLGGLQVLVPNTTSWQYVRPVPGYIICNIGDALNIYSGGILRSNLHRVVPPPGQQVRFDRWSLVYFFRPHSDSELRPLVESPMVAAAVISNNIKVEPNTTAGEWFTRRTKNFRAKNWKGPKTWEASRGTEHIKVDA